MESTFLNSRSVEHAWNFPGIINTTTFNITSSCYLKPDSGSLSPLDIGLAIGLPLLFIVLLFTCCIFPSRGSSEVNLIYKLHSTPSYELHRKMEYL